MNPATLRAILAHAAEHPATLGTSRLICVDGPAGSGKTTLGDALAQAASYGDPDAVVVLHMDDFYEGWEGLTRGIADRLLRSLIAPLARGRAARVATWDWHAAAWGPEVTVAPAPLIVLEGVGSGALAYAESITTLVWVDAPHEERMARGVARDGASFAAHWESWAVQERDLFAVERTRERAHLYIDGLGNLA